MNQLVKRNTQAIALKGKMAELFSDAFEQSLADLSSGVSVGFPVLSIKGKAFHIKQGGDSTLVENPNDPGEPATSLNVVLVKANPYISKVYYENGYEEGADTKPTCYSNNGIAPEDDSEVKQNPKCASCPKNQWGSRITDNGKKGKACSDSRRVAIAPADDPENAMLLRVPAASLKPLMVYGKALSQRGIPYQAVITKLSFDHTVAHPLLKFSAAGLLPEELGDKVVDAMNGEVVEAILNGGGAEQVAQELAGEGEDDEGFEQVEKAHAARQQETRRPAAPQKPKATAKPGAGVAAAEIAGIVGDEPEVEPEPVVTKPVTKPTTAKATNTAAASAAGGTAVDGNVDSMLGDLLKEFDDSDE